MMNDRILVPMAIRYRKVEDKMVYTGFIPGFDGNDVISDTLEECKTLLKKKLISQLDEYLANNKQLPFFPTKEELQNDFDDIVYIKVVEI